MFCLTVSRLRNQSHGLKLFMYHFQPFYVSFSFKISIKIISNIGDDDHYIELELVPENESEMVPDNDVEIVETVHVPVRQLNIYF